MVLRRRLGEMLIEAGLLDEAMLNKALEVQKESGRKLGAVLMHEGLIEEDVLLNFLRQQIGIDVVSSTDLEIEDEAWEKVPKELIEKYSVLPLKFNNRELSVAMSDPMNLEAIEDLRFATSSKIVKVVLAAESTIESILQERYHSQGLFYDIIDHGELYQKAMEKIDKTKVSDIPIEEVEEEHVSTHVIQLESATSPIINIVNYIFYEAYRRKASDIHIEPYQKYFRVRFRIDGVLYSVLAPPHRLHAYLVSRIKIMSEMDISKRRVPQDGHLVLKIRAEVIHFRVSTLPTAYGEKCVLRVIRKQKHLEDLNAIGFEPRVLSSYKKIISMPQGMILFTGPTGSGKTTSLYASLNFVNNPNNNIVTLEDPVESTLFGINHVQIREKYGLSFADGLRSILRQDPDILFIGEIRDSEVAKIAIRASMTGHLVFSTLHANTTTDSVERLIDMDVEPFLVSSTLLAIVGQRLLRRVCSNCKKPYVPIKEEIKEFDLDDIYLSDASFYKGEGCDKCMRTGYSGQIAAFEVLFVTEDIRKLIRERISSHKMREFALQDGFHSILQDGLQKVHRGITTFDEVRRVLMSEAYLD